MKVTLRPRLLPYARFFAVLAVIGGVGVCGLTIYLSMIGTWQFFTGLMFHIAASPVAAVLVISGLLYWFADRTTDQGDKPYRIIVGLYCFAWLTVLTNWPMQAMWQFQKGHAEAIVAQFQKDQKSRMARLGAIDVVRVVPGRDGSVYLAVDKSDHTGLLWTPDGKVEGHAYNTWAEQRIDAHWFFVVED